MVEFGKTSDAHDPALAASVGMLPNMLKRPTMHMAL